MKTHTAVTALPRAAFAAALLALGAAASAPAGAQAVRKGLPGAPQRDSAQPRQRGQQVGTIDGFVGDTNLVALQAAEVKIVSTNVKVSTGPNGRFRFERVPVGPYVLVIRRTGYQPTSAVVQVGTDTLRPSYSLERATSLEAAVVTAQRTSPRMAEFEMRRRVGRGEFMDEAQIKKHGGVYTTELMRRFSTVNVSPSYSTAIGGLPEQLAISRREGANPSLGACPMAVFIDNVPMPTPFNLDMLPSPRWLAGIEVYNGTSTTPAQYSGTNRACGVILVWTKDGY